MARPAATQDKLALQAQRALQGRLHAWPKVQHAAEICAANHQWPLLPPLPDPLDLAAGQARVLSQVLTVVHRAINPVPQSTTAIGLGCFPDIPLSSDVFLANVHLALRLLLAQKRAAPYRFIDVGCGGGLKVVLASEVFHTADGLEYDPGYVENARGTMAAMQARRCEILHGNAVTFEDYGDYDVIYFYRPMRIEEGLHAMEARIAQDARPGAILIAPYEQFVDRAEMLGCVPVSQMVYVKGITPAQAEELAAEASRMGPHIVNPTNRQAHRFGWLAPLAHACEMNGIRPGYRGGGLSALL